jgi:hypothetical protein
MSKTVAARLLAGAFAAIACVAAPPARSRAEPLRGALPPGPLAPAGPARWSFSSVPGAPEQEAIAFLYLSGTSTAVSLALAPAPPEIRAIEVYANGSLSARMDGAGPVDDRAALGFRPGAEVRVPLSVGLRRGLNRIGLVARYSAASEDSLDPRRPPWRGTALFEPGRLVELPLFFRGLERVFSMQAMLYQALRRFDHEVRTGHPPGPQVALARALGEVEELRHSLAHDRSVALALVEADRLYLESWGEPGAGGLFLTRQLDAAREIPRAWSATQSFQVAHEIYRGASRRATLYGPLTDVALSRENLRNACAVLATRSGEAAPDALGSLVALLSADAVLLAALERSATGLGADLAARVREILTTYPGWREQFLLGHAAVRASRKTEPADYPSRAVVEHEARVAAGTLDQIRSLVQRDLVFGRLLTELVASMLEPRVGPPGVPRKNW